jgi:GAF domain-containing protein
MTGAPSALRWRARVASSASIARLALGQSGGHVAATRVLYDGLFTSAADTAGLVHDAPDRAVLVVALECGPRRVGVMALADRSGRVFSDDEVALAERLTRPVAREIVHGRGHAVAGEAIERLLELLGGETAALYTLVGDGGVLALVTAR